MMSAVYFYMVERERMFKANGAKFYQLVKLVKGIQKFSKMFLRIFW